MKRTDVSEVCALDRARIVFESYNTVIEECYNRFLKNSRGDKFLADAEDNIQECLDSLLKDWSSTPLKDMDGITPEEFFYNIQDFGELIELFKAGSEICHEGLPEALVRKIREYGDAAVDAMIEIARDKSLINEKDIVIPLMAIKVLGVWKENRAVGPLIDMMFVYEDGDYDIIREHIIDALTAIGQPALEHVLAKAEPVLRNAGTGWIPGNAFEGLISVLAAAGKGHKSDSIYFFLKNAFRKTGSVYIAACLGTYGDGRAIPLLRGYVEKNIDKIDIGTFYEIKKAVEELGGNMDDVRP